MVQCFRCNAGFKLAILNKATLCVDATADCHSSLTYRGLPAYLNALLSCHVCKDNTLGQPRFPLLSLQVEVTSSTITKIVDFNNSPSITADVVSCQLALISIVPNCAVYALLK